MYEGTSTYPTARNETMFRIGDFSKLSRVSIKTLRYYDEIGLLKPHDIDRFTRYRYYSTDQLMKLNRILVLKELGFSLEQIASLLAEDLSQDQLKGMLLLRKAEIEQQVRSAQQQLAQINNRLKLIEQESQKPPAEVKEQMIMEPKIVQLDKFMAVGMPYLGKNENSEIGQMWDKFMPRMAEIKHLAPGPEIAYGLCFQNQSGLVDYVASLPVTELTDIPEGMVGREVPAQTYAVFECLGIKNIGPTYHYILNEWLPKSGFRPGDGADFEYYPETFNDAADPASLLYIYFPIVKA